MPMLVPMHSVTAVLVDAVHFARDARDAMERGDMGLAVSALVGAGSWLGMAHSWAAQVTRGWPAEHAWALQLRRVRRVRAHVDRITRQVMAVVDGRAAVLITKAPRGVVGQA